MIPKLFHLRGLPHRRTSHNIECHHHIACRLPSRHDYICTRPLQAIHQVADPGPPPHALVPTRQKGHWENSSTAKICCARLVNLSSGLIDTVTVPGALSRDMLWFGRLGAEPKVRGFDRLSWRSSGRRVTGSWCLWRPPREHLGQHHSSRRAHGQLISVLTTWATTPNVVGSNFAATRPTSLRCGACYSNLLE